MAADSVKQDGNARLAVLKKENELLLAQLHEVQEALQRELERAPTRPADGKTAGDAAAAWVAEELPEVLAENQRLQALVEAQQQIHPLEARNALNVRLGDLLIQGTNSFGGLLALPFRLIKAWRVYARRKPPRALGGEQFARVCEAYEKGGFAAVEILLTKAVVSPTLQANAYTALARRLIEKKERQEAAEAARRAHAQEPQPFRLKWLAFREHEAGNTLRAESLLALLPGDTELSESEAREVRRLRHAAKEARQARALQESSYEERKDAAEQPLKQLRDEVKKLQAQNSSIQANLAKLQKEQSISQEREEKLKAEKKKIVALQQQQEEKNAALAKQNEEIGARVAQSAKEAETLKVANKQLEDDEKSLIEQLHRVQEELEDYYLKNRDLEKKLTDKIKDLDDATGRADQAETDSKALHIQINQLEEDKVALDEALRQAHLQAEAQWNTVSEENQILRARLDASEVVYAELQETLTLVREQAEVQLTAMSEKNEMLETRASELELLAEGLMADWEVEQAVSQKELMQYREQTAKSVDETRDLRAAVLQAEQERTAAIAEMEKMAVRMDDATVLAEARLHEIRDLRAIQVMLRAELDSLKQAQVESHEAATLQFAAARSEYEEERSKLVGELDALTTIIEARQKEVQTLADGRETHRIEMEKEKNELRLQLEESQFLLKQQQDSIEGLKVTQQQLEIEKDALATDLAASEQQHALSADEYASVEHRQRLMDEELARADAQISLIKDMLL